MYLSNGLGCNLELDCEICDSGVDVRRNVMKAKNIVIKSTSGFCPVVYAYNDKLSITPDSIEYEYKPYLESESILNPYKKWSYKTANSIYPLAFEKIADAVDEILKRELDAFYTDIGAIDFIVIYGDGSKASRSFKLLSDEFADCFKIIKKIVPATEFTPKVIKIYEDCHNEEE